MMADGSFQESRTYLSEACDPFELPHGGYVPKALTRLRLSDVAPLAISVGSIE
jgi:hypothetical protein